MTSTSILNKKHSKLVTSQAIQHLKKTVTDLCGIFHEDDYVSELLQHLNTIEQQIKIDSEAMKDKNYQTQVLQKLSVFIKQRSIPFKEGPPYSIYT